MALQNAQTSIATMPRGGPTASRLDRWLQTDKLEYTDRYDIADDIKQSVVSALDRMGTRFNQHEGHARTALSLVTDVAAPRILEIGSGHGRLSAEILKLHPTATVTVSDLDPTSVANIAASPLGSHPRARTQVVDATAIDAADNSYDLVVFAQAFHHLTPTTAVLAIAEATRVARSFLVIDLPRPHPVSLLLTPVVLAPLAAVLTVTRSSLRHVIHDGYISLLRAYSPSAFTALAKAAHPRMTVNFLPTPSIRIAPRHVSLEFSRPQSATGNGGE